MSKFSLVALTVAVLLGVFAFMAIPSTRSASAETTADSSPCKLLNDVGPKTAAQAAQPVAAPAVDAGDLAKFSGVWEGKWGGSAPSVIIITVTKAGHADAFYGYNGPASQNAESTTQFGMDYLSGTLSDTKGSYSFTLNDNGVLVGKFFGASINMNACKP